jgi:short-subunit dehydrogenase involved in D-alanine esterification of teichoic acids
MRISGNQVLITGGTSGIGLALAKKFREAGNHVIVTGRDETKLRRVGQNLSIEVERANMSNPTDLQNLAAKYPDVNILVNNAGVQYSYTFTDQNVPFERITEELAINLVGPLQLIKLFLPQLLTKQEAAIVNVTSGLAIVPKQSAPVYCGSKAGLHIATKSLRWQLEATPVRVFEAISALVDTPMTEGRGKGKITPTVWVDEFWKSFERNHYEIRIGKVKQLMLVERFLPPLAERIMRPGL